MFNFFGKYENYRKRHAQIATFFTLLIAIIFLFVAVTINIYRTARIKETSSRASDSAALMLASYVGSYASQLWEYNERKVKKCERDWGLIVQYIMVAIMTIILTVVTWGAFSGSSSAIWAALFANTAAGFVHTTLALSILGFAASIYNATNYYNDTGKQMNAANRRMRLLPIKDQFREMAIQQALAMLVSDPKMIEDEFDYDEDGMVSDKVSRFMAWYHQRMINLVKIEKKSSYTQAVKNLKQALDRIYLNLINDELGVNSHHIDYLDEDSDGNRDGSYVELCEGEHSDGGSSYRDGQDHDFNSLLYKILYGAYRNSGDSTLAGLYLYGGVANWWHTPMIGESGEACYDEWQQRGDQVDRVLIGLRGMLTSSDGTPIPNDGFLGFLKSINQMSVKQMKSNELIWMTNLSSEFDIPDADGYDLDDDESEVFLYDEIVEWLGFVQGWRTSVYTMLGQTDVRLRTLNDAIDICTEDCDGLIANRDEVQDCYDDLLLAVDFLVFFYGALDSARIAIEQFIIAYNAHVDPVPPGNEVNNEYKSSARYSWKQRYCADDECVAEEMIERWHHVRVTVPFEIKLPYIKTSRGGFLKTKICYHLRRGTNEGAAEGLRVETSEYNPGTAGDYVYFADRKDEEDFQLWSFRYTSSRLDEGLPNDNEFSGGEDGEDDYDVNDNGVIDDYEVFTSVDDGTGKIYYLDGVADSPCQNKRDALLNGAGIDSSADGFYTYLPEYYTQANPEGDTEESGLAWLGNLH